MHWTVTFYLLVGVVNSINIKEDVEDVKAKIVGGHPVNIRFRPFMLSLHAFHEFRCGASIISPTWGITALHCIASFGEKYFVRAGSNYVDKGGCVHQIRRIHAYNDSTYPFWFNDMFYHDIALFEVTPPFRFSRTTRPVSLPDQRTELPRRLYVSGWGLTDFEKKKILRRGLRGVYVHYVPFHRCVAATPEYATFVNRDYHLCYGGNGKDSCYGDSGGPLASFYTLHGIVSFGRDCGIMPGVYVNVIYYRQWINQLTNL